MESAFPQPLIWNVSLYVSGMFSHQGEHGFGGGEEFGVGDVVDDFGGADAGGEDEGAAAAAVLLVAGGEGDEFCGGGVEGREGAVAEDEVGHAVGIFFG